MIRKILIAVCCFFCTHNFFAQSFIKGKISEKGNKEGLPGVIAACGSKSVLTDINGNFFITTATGKQTFIASLIGYKTYKKELDCKENDTFFLAIELEEANQVLDEVVVSAGKYEQ